MKKQKGRANSRPSSAAERHLLPAEAGRRDSRENPRPAQRGEGGAKRRVRGVLLAAIVVVIALAVAGVYAFRRHAATSIQSSRDIILITIDTTRADALGYAGNKRVKTPFLDSLGGRGIVFTNAHAHNVVTLPSHVNILTGLYAY